MTPTMDPSVRGNQPAGWKRWKRAEQWAKTHPHTAQAKKYLARVAAAREIQAVAGDRAWLHYEKPSEYAVRLGRASEDDREYKWQTCSTKCAVLQLQVDTGCAGLEDLHSVAGTTRKVLVPRPADSKRRGKCKCCGGDMV